MNHSRKLLQGMLPSGHRHRAVLALMTVLSIMGAAAIGSTVASANAANPLPTSQGSATSTGVVVTNADGSVLVKSGTVAMNVSGTWDWASQTSCSSRYGVGWAVDWDGISTSPTAPSSVGSWQITSTHPALYFHVFEHDMQTVPPAPNGDTYPFTSPCQQTDAQGHPTGPWSAIHTYAAGSTIPASLCVNLYDLHGKPGAISNISDFDPSTNTDNSIKTNDFNPQVGSGYCFHPHFVTPTSTLKALIFLCDPAGSPTTTPETGAFTYSGALLTGTGASPLSATVPAGDYQVAAVPGDANFQLVACGSTSGTAAQKTVNVPPGGTGTATFYVAPIAAPPSTGTLLGRIFLCQDGTTSVTAEPGTIGFTGATVGSGASPLSQTVIAGSYTVTASAGSGFSLVSCGTSGNASSQAVSVPAGGTGTATFYETANTPADCDGDHDASDCTPGNDCSEAPQQGTAPCQGTLVGRVYLCNNNATTTTPEPGTIAFTGSSTGTGASPLQQTVAPGAYTVSATAAQGFILVACGTTAGVSSQAVNVPAAGSGTAIFYETPAPGTLTGVIKDCTGNVLSGGTVTAGGANVQAPGSAQEAPGTYAVTATPPANDVMVSCNNGGGTVAPTGTSAVQTATVAPGATTTVVFYAQPVSTGVLGCTTSCGAGPGNPPATQGVQAVQGTQGVQAVQGAQPAAVQGVLGAATAQPHTGHSDWVTRAMLALAMIVVGGALVRGLRPAGQA